MMEENQEELQKLEVEMKNLLEELECNQEYVLHLRKEKDIDRNIFSPRSYDADSDRKIEQAENKVEQIKNEVEYIRERIETFLKKKKEYEKILGEIKAESETGASLKQLPLINEKDPYIATSTKIKESDKQEVLKNLKELYKKTEIALALLNSDRNKCKNELKGIMKLIKETASKIENKGE